MSKQTKILWVQDEYDGPMNGLAEYNQEKVWFSRMNTPTDRMYELYRLSEQMLIDVTNNHICHCDKTGYPLNHGDPFKIKRRNKGTKISTEVFQGQDEIEVELERRSMSIVKKYEHFIIPSDVKGELITTIYESDFNNYLVPRTCIMDDF